MGPVIFEMIFTIIFSVPLQQSKHDRISYWKVVFPNSSQPRVAFHRRTSCLICPIWNETPGWIVLREICVDLFLIVPHGLLADIFFLESFQFLNIYNEVPNLSFPNSNTEFRPSQISKMEFFTKVGALTIFVKITPS